MRLHVNWAQTLVLTLGLGSCVYMATLPEIGNCEYMQTEDPLRVCYQEPLGQAQDPLDALAATQGHDCVRAEDWPGGEVPAWVVAKRDGVVEGMDFGKAWADAQAGLIWVEYICR